MAPKKRHPLLNRRTKRGRCKGTKKGRGKGGKRRYIHPRIRVEHGIHLRRIKDSEQNNSQESLSVDDLHSWDATLSKSFPIDWVQQVLSLGSGGFILSTDASGAGLSHESLTHALTMYETAASEHLGVTAQFHVCIASDSDSGDTQLATLTELSHVRCGGCACVHHRPLDLFTPEAKELMQAMLPDGVGVGKHTAEELEPVEEFLQQSDWALPENKSCFCHVHRARCPINPGWVIQMQSRNKTATEIAAALDPPCTEVPSTSWWARCNEVVGTGTDPDEVASPPPLVMNITGLAQLLGCATAKAGCDVSLELLGWLKQRAQLAAKCQEDLFIAYLPDKFPLRKLKDMCQTHEVVVVKTTAEKMGFPSKLGYTLVAGIAKHSLVWLGPDDDGDNQKEFEQRFHRRRSTSGTIYLTAGEDEIFENNMKLAAHSSKTFLESYRQKTFDEYADKVCAPCHLVHKGQYERAIRKSENARDDPVAEMGEYFANLDVPPRSQVIDSCMPSFKPFLYSPRLFSWGVERFATPMELLGCFGVDLREGLPRGTRELSPLADILPRLTWEQRLGVLKSGVHVPVLAAWISYVLGQCARRPALEALPATIGGRYNQDEDTDFRAFEEVD